MNLNVATLSVCYSPYKLFLEISFFTIQFITSRTLLILQHKLRRSVFVSNLHSKRSRNDVQCQSSRPRLSASCMFFQRRYLAVAALLGPECEILIFLLYQKLSRLFKLFNVGTRSCMDDRSESCRFNSDFTPKIYFRDQERRRGYHLGMERPAI